ncbi:LAQU0S13e02564g1_1 [Lachancea quebecensis]|uniref:LAQU0S13e02564g1_1 n=1 Tax=Lachancea quebecensis TaxID=1654605 RepID=A0A0P1KUY1_9SACH|nr:LAQU0S13e02564g1_1 [Lachancea quebecensis]
MKVAIEHVQLQFIKEIENNVCSLQVESNVMCFALKTGHMFLIDLETPSNVIKYRFTSLSSPQEKLLKVWMDPSATTLLLKTNFAKYYVLAVESLGKGNELVTPLKKLSKKNRDVITVTWQGKYEFVCGTAEGKVYIVNTQSENSATKAYSSPNSIDGLEFVNSPGAEQCAFLATGHTLRYWSNPKDPLTTLTELPPSETEQFEEIEQASSRKLAFFNDTFAWTIDSGTIFGTVKRSDNVLKSATVLLNVELPASHHRVKDVALSKYHLLLLRGSEILVINKLNNEVVTQKTTWNQGNEKILELVVDYSQSPPTFWCYSTSNIYEIVLEEESKGIWRLLNKFGKYDEALKLPDLAPAEKDFILEQKGDYLFSKKDFVEAARCYGMSDSATTAEVALKLMKCSDFIALQTFLTAKLSTARQKKGSIVQITLLSDWIVWNFMQMLNEVDESISSEQDDHTLETWRSKKEHIGKELMAFFKKNLEILDRDTVYQIMSRQNRKLEVLSFARLINDYKFVLSYWIRSKNWYEALKVLALTQDLECVYKYATILLINSPDSTVNTWMQIRDVNPCELISPLLTYFANFQKTHSSLDSSRPVPNYALKYLKWCIQELDAVKLTPIVYNTTIFMMIAGFDAKGRESEIIEFIEEHSGYFDSDFVLRLSIKFKRFKTCIYVYSWLRLYEEAVTLAIKMDLLDDAKLVASSSDLDGNSKVRRKLWLMIAQRIIKQQNDTKQAIKEILQDSNGILGIKDLLPLFEEFTTIANVKDELIKGLERHNSTMAHVSHEIENSIKIKKEIVEDIETLKARFQLVEPGASCDCCGRVLQTRKFYVFPCGHSFHTDCLVREILKSTDHALRSKIESIQRSATKGMTSVNLKELDRLLSTKCCLCSDIKINSIDEPLEFDESERQAWEI